MRHSWILLALMLLPVAADAGCGGRGAFIDQRSDAQYRSDIERGRTRCVVFVLAGPIDRLRQGWVEWHHEHDGRIESTRLGLYSAGRRGGVAFGRLPRATTAEPGSSRLVVLLPTSYWLLVNTTRLGWQMRSGLVEEPDRATVRKLFTDVGLNAGLGDAARSLIDIRRLAESRPR